MSPYESLGFDHAKLARGLRNLRAFLASDKTHMRTHCWPNDVADKAETLKLVRTNVHMLINAKATGDLCSAMKAADPDWDMYSDQRAVHNRINHRIVVRQFSTKWANRRFSHLLTGWED